MANRDLQSDVEKKLERRDKRKKKQMKVSGKSVIKLKKIIKEKMEK